jgi:hypothetical protein
MPFGCGSRGDAGQNALTSRLESVCVAQRPPRTKDDGVCRSPGSPRRFCELPKPYKFTGFGDIHVPKFYKFIGFGDIHGPKPYKFRWFGDIHDPKPYEFIRSGAMGSLDKKQKTQLLARVLSAAGIGADSCPECSWAPCVQFRSILGPLLGPQKAPMRPL